MPDPGTDFLEAAHGDLKSSEREKVEFWSFPRFHEKHEAVFRRFFEERFGRIRAAGPRPGEWLDVGCGYGFWNRFLREKGIRTFGIEPVPEAAAFCRDSFGLPVNECRFEDFEPGRRFSVIVGCDVLEHLERPDLALAKCHRMLEPGGLLYLQVPDVLGFRVPGGHGLGLPYHLWQFNARSLSRLLESRGFVPLKRWAGVQGVIGVYEAGGPDWLTRAKWTIARGLKLGNRLQLLARKVDA